MPSLLANRYAPLAAESNQLGWPLRAHDIAFDRIVVLKFLRAELGEDLPALPRLTEMLHELRALAHLDLVRYFNIEDSGEGPLLIREWVSGISLLDLLRRRRALGVWECVRLLAPLPETLDGLANRGMALPPDLLSKLLLEGDENDPSCRLKLNPLSIRSYGYEANRNVTINQSREDARAKNVASRLFFWLLYDLLGGSRKVGIHFTPLSALNEAGNSRLKALGNGDYSSCGIFWGEFTGALNGEIITLPRGRARRANRPLAWEIAGAVPPDALAGDVLQLVPDRMEAIPIRLVARSSFGLGRAYHEADFTTRLLPESEANYERTGRISRVHVRFEIMNGKVTLRDGNGRNASGNGSWFNGVPLLADPAMTLSHHGILNLANEYRLEVAPLFHDHVSDCCFNDFAGETALIESETGDMTEELHGSMMFIPLDGQKPLCDSIWLFSGIGFGLNSDGQIIWDYYGEGGSPGALLYHQNRFWIKNTGLPEAAAIVGEVPLRRTQIAQLTPTQKLRLGSRLYLIQ